MKYNTDVMYICRIYNSESFLYSDVSTVMILYWTCLTPFYFYMEDFTSVTTVITSCSGYHYDVSQGCLHCMISPWMFSPCWNRVRFTCGSRE